MQTIDSPHSGLQHYLAQFNILDRAEIDQLKNLGHLKSLKKGSYFCREGEVINYFAYIYRGIFRSYFTDSKEKETTYCIRFPHCFLSAYSSLLTGAATRENIQALTDAELLYFSKSDLERLSASSPQWLALLKLLAETEYITLEQRIFLHSESAPERYRQLLKKEPELIRHIPLGHLASYLGITQRHLSRLRKEIRF